MIICQCTGTTDRDIARLRENGAGTIAAISGMTGAGRNCGPCRREILRLLADSSNNGSSATA
jgi:bacterioferritin-associated ferredoxin